MAGQGHRGMLIVVVVLALCLLAALIAIGVLVHRTTSNKHDKVKTPELYYSPSMNGVIDFTQGNPSTYEQYTNELSDDLEDYSRDRQQGEEAHDCSDGVPEMSAEQFCVFPLNVLGSECTPERDFGYYEGRPCVLLSLETILGWSDHGLCDEAAPPELKGKTTPGHMMVTCEGENPSSVDNIGPIAVWPKGGFDLKYYPASGQENYRKPLVMVQFPRLRSGVVVKVTCKVWSDQIRHTGNSTDGQGGSVTFRFMMD